MAKSTQDLADLAAAVHAARAVRSAAEQVLVFAERLTPDVGPAEMAEYDILIAREATALSERVEAFGTLGLGAGSIDATGDQVDPPRTEPAD
jgi:hypothetical protein